MEAILRRLDFQVRVQDDGEWDLLPPVYRLDVGIPEDVAEEVGRMHGYENVLATLPGHRRTSWRPATSGLERRLDAMRHALAGAGFTEVVTPALTSGALLDRLELGARALRVLNRNHGRPSLAAFEIGRAYLRQPQDAGQQPGEQPAEPVRLAAVRTGLGGPGA